MFIVPVSRDYRETRQLSRLIDGTFERFFASTAGTARTSGNTEPAARTPALDVAESNSAYTARLDLPGVAKEDVQVSVDGRRVTVRTHTQADKPVVQAAAQAGDQAATDTAVTPSTPAADADRIVYRERAAASYARTFTLPVEVELADAGAKLENGVLTLTLPKRNPRHAAQLTVN